MIAWNAFPRRQDLIAEVATTFNVNGDYTSDTYDSSGIDTVRIAAYDLPADVNFQVVEGVFTTASTDGGLNAVNDHQLTVDANGEVYAEIPLTGRYFWVGVSNGPVNGSLVYAIRKVR
jgi:hypothetical protein